VQSAKIFSSVLVGGTNVNASRRSSDTSGLQVLWNTDSAANWTADEIHGPLSEPGDAFRRFYFLRSG